MNQKQKPQPSSNLEDVEPEVVVIGGGLAGLTAAATISAAGRRVVVHEKLGVSGGDARSIDKDGFTFNTGPHALYRGGEAERTLQDLGVKISGGVPPTKGRIIIGGVSHIAPAGGPTLFQTKAFPLAAKLQIAKVLALLPRQRPHEHSHVTVRQWIAKMVSHDLAATFLEGLVRLTTYSNQPDSFSADAAISQLQAGLSTGVTYLDGGWQTLVDQLTSLPGVNIALGDAIAELPDAPAVIIAAGGPSLANTLLGTTFEVGPKAEVSVMDFGLNRRPDHDVVIGADTPFYFSNHSAVARLAPTNHFHAAAMQYLANGEEPDQPSIEAFATHAGVREGDVVASRRLHRMTAATATPTAALGGMTGRPTVADTGHSNVFIAGDWVGSTGLLADAAVASGKNAALAALEQLK